LPVDSVSKTETRPQIGYFEKSGGMCCIQRNGDGWVTRPGAYDSKPSHLHPLPLPPESSEVLG
jgi:hypothetical protein